MRFYSTMTIFSKVTEFWELIKPLVDFKYEVIETRLNSMFELATQDEIDKLRSSTGGGSDSQKQSSEVLELEDLDDLDKTLHIKGQMVFIQEWQQMLFLACPIMKGLNNLLWSGLFINDLSMHDYSRDIMLANAQTDMEANLLKMQLAKKIAMTRKNNDKAATMAKQNTELAQHFLPPMVLGDVIQGKDPATISAKVDRSATLIVEFGNSTEFLAKAKAVDVINFFNNVESIFDHLVLNNKCYRMESSSEYAVETGAAIQGGNPVEDICNLALDLKEATSKAIKDPANKKAVNLLIGIEVGSVHTGLPGRSGITF